MKQLLVVDDHPLYREALCKRLERDLNISTTCADSVEKGIDTILNNTNPWIVIVDISVQRFNGVESIKTFKSYSNVEHVVAITSINQQSWEKRCIFSGASLFLPKNLTTEYISDSLRRLVTSNIKIEIHAESLVENFRLTSKQVQVLKLLAEEHSNKVIAGYLDITEQTVKIHINQIFRELRVFNRTQAVIKAQTHLLI